MTGLPSATITLDDGTNTYPTDISSQVELEEGVTVAAYGRADEAPTAQAATLTLTLDNTDGSFTSGFGFDTGPFGAGPFGGGSVSLSPGQGIRFTETIGATTRNRFTGRISGAELGWPGGGEKYATIQLTAVDPLADASRKVLRSMLEEEILRRSPTAYYTLGEAEGSTAAGDSSGNQAAPLAIAAVAAGSGTGITFGAATGPGTDGLTAASFGGREYLLGPTPAGTTFSVSCWFSVPTTPTFDMTLLYVQGCRIDISPTGLGVAASIAFSDRSGGAGGLTEVGGGGVHHAVMTGDGTTMKGYVDGVLFSTFAMASIIRGPLSVGSKPNEAGFNALIANASHVAVWGSILSASDVAAIYNAGIGTSETTSLRLARLAAYGLGFTTSTTTGMSGQIMGAQQTSGKSLADALQDVALAEGGVLYANGSGTLILQGRNYRNLKVVADQTLTAIEVGPDTGVTIDTQQTINKVTVTRTSGATQTVQNTSSITSIGEFPTSLDLPVDTDANALLAAQWVLAKHTSPDPRLGSATFELLNSPVAEQIFQREIGDRLSLSGMPSQLWPATGDVTLEGWTETLTHESWTITANLLPWTLFKAFILDSATLGVLDGTAQLGY